MSPAPIFHARVSLDGQVQLAEQERRARKEHLRTLAGCEIEIVMRKIRSQRSLDQNAYIHSQPIPILAEHCGNTIPEMKLILMGECFGWHTVSGHELPIKPSTAEMTVEECAYFIDWVIPWAAEKFDVRIPLPNEVE